MKVEEIRNIGVIGAGLMGHGIAQVFAIKGYKVKLFDNDSGVLKSAPERIRNNLQTLLEMGLVEFRELEDCLNRIQLCHTLTEMCEGVELAIEAVSENLDLKRTIFSDLERLTPPQTILCSNTSGISISLISEKLQFKERVVGTHFWNPPHIIPCVEVIKSQFGSDEVFHTVVELMKRVGKEPVRVLIDVPGFLGNRLQHALWREAISLVEKGIAEPEDIDRVVKYGFGLRLPFLGPLETADLAGLDLTYDVHQYLFLDLENRSTPSPLLKTLVDQKTIGVKAKKGFYHWTDESIKQIIQQRDEALLKITEVIKGLNREKKK
ncbi:MAG TPA: 3-hydroxyacyl-CoA dehydrogenase NAD-binding domain-containing protein [Thermodesulfobacteriota bacterium]|nr:3-hydroxyacyl-CoA dehydrogenase NAD-binding domain-containing protein [Thermodesulfobacteriota bacterium]